MYVQHLLFDQPYNRQLSDYPKIIDWAHWRAPLYALFGMEESDVPNGSQGLTIRTHKTALLTAECSENKAASMVAVICSAPKMLPVSSAEVWVFWMKMISMIWMRY